MNNIVRNILAVIVGWVTGSIINMGLLQLGYQIFPMEGFDPDDIETLIVVMPTLDFRYFIFPFLAHAIGTLVGALVASLIVKRHMLQWALIIGLLFLIGGILASWLIPAPTWFVITDLILAYIPMAWIGGRIGRYIKKTPPTAY